VNLLFIDCYNKGQRSKNIRAIENTGTKDEVRLAKTLWKVGYRYLKNNKTIFGKLDITFKNYNGNTC